MKHAIVLTRVQSFIVSFCWC